MKAVVTHPQFPPTKLGTTAFVRKLTYVYRVKRQHKLRIKNKQQRQMSLFTYCSKYWAGGLSSVAKGYWNAQAAGNNFITFYQTALPATGKLFYIRTALIGLYNRQYIDGHITPPSPPFGGSDALEPIIIVTAGTITTSFVLNGYISTDWCACWITDYQYSFTTEKRIPLLSCGAQLALQNPVVLPGGDIQYTQVWTIPPGGPRLAPQSCRVYWMGFNQNVATIPYEFDMQTS